MYVRSPCVSGRFGNDRAVLSRARLFSVVLALRDFFVAGASTSQLAAGALYLGRHFRCRQASIGIARQCMFAAGILGAENDFQANANFIAILRRTMDFVATESEDGVPPALERGCDARISALFNLEHLASCRIMV